MVFPDLNVFEQIEFFGLVSTMIVFIKGIFIKVFVRDVRKLL